MKTSAIVLHKKEESFLMEGFLNLFVSPAT